MIYDQLTKDIKNAMLEKNAIKRDCLRAIVSEIKNKTINAGKEITDSICLDVIKKSVKQHNDSIENFKIGNREDLAVKELEELSYISGYLPKMLDENETKILIEDIIKMKNIEPIKKNMGLIMKSFDQNIDKKIASKILNSVLK